MSLPCSWKHRSHSSLTWQKHLPWTAVGEHGLQQFPYCPQGSYREEQYFVSPVTLHGVQAQSDVPRMLLWSGEENESKSGEAGQALEQLGPGRAGEGPEAAVPSGRQLGSSVEMDSAVLAGFIQPMLLQWDGTGCC